MTIQSFEHCIDQVVRFHFPNKRNLRHTHWNARHHLIDPLWVHASVLEFVRSIQDSMTGLLLVSGLRESLKERKSDGLPSANKSTWKFEIYRNFGGTPCPTRARPLRFILLGFLLGITSQQTKKSTRSLEFLYGFSDGSLLRVSDKIDKEKVSPTIFSYLDGFDLTRFKPLSEKGFNAFCKALFHPVKT